MTQIISTIAPSKPNKNTKPLLAYFGHHKAGSSSIVSIIADVCSQMCLKRGAYQMGGYYKPKEPGYDLQTFAEENNLDFVIYRNADSQHIENLTNYKGFHVVRDPRDILVSAYFSHLHSHGTKNWHDLTVYRQKLQKLDKYEGLLMEMEFSRVNFEKMYDWDYSLSNVLDIKMEDLFANSQEQFINIFKFLGILDSSTEKIGSDLNDEIAKTVNRVNIKTNGLFPLKFSREKISGERISKIVAENSFAKKAKGRKKGKENLKHHYRKGVKGDWKNHLTAEHIIAFKDNYNDLLLKLGYESDPDWWKSYL